MEKVYSVLQFLLDNWEAVTGIALFLYEVIARVTPTEKDVTTLGLVHKVLNAVVANRRKESTTDVVAKDNEAENVVQVKRNRHILHTIAFLLLANFAFAQVGTEANVKSVNLKGATPSVYMTRPIGTIFFNTDSGGFMLKDNLGWFNPRNSLGNFWKLSGTSTLLGNTTITGPTYDLTFNTKSFNATEHGNGLFLTENGGGLFLRGTSGGIAIDQSSGGGIVIGRSIWNNGGITIQDRNTININAFNSSGINKFNFSLDGVGETAFFNDNTSSPKGIVLGGNYTTDPHSVADKTYVDNAITSATTGAALTKADDSNVTLTLIGTPATSLLRSVQISAGWMGRLPYSRFTQGSGLSILGVASATTSDQASIVGTTNQVLRVNTAGTGLGFGSIDLSQSGTVGTSRLGYSNLTQGSALSVLGVTGGSTADQASIVGTTDQVLRVNGTGTGMGFGSIDLSKSATVGSSLLNLTNGGTGSSTKNFVDISTNQTSIAGDKSWTGNHTWTVGSGVTPMTLVRTADFSATDKIFRILNNTSTEIHSISNLGVGNWNLYNNSGTQLGSVAYSTPGGSGPGIIFTNSGATTRYDILHNTGNTALNIYNNISSTGTKVIIGGTNTTTATSTETLAVRTDQNGFTYQTIANTTNNTAASAGLYVTSGDNTFAKVGALRYLSASYSSSGMFQADKTLLYSNGGNGLNIGTSSNTPMQIWTNGAQRISVPGTGELLIGTGATSPVAGEKLLVRTDQNNYTSLGVLNGTNGTAASAGIIMRAGATNFSDAISINSFAPSFTSTGITQASKAVISAANLNGLNIGTTIATPLQFWVNNAYQGGLLSTGQTMVGADATALLGTEKLLVRTNQNANTYMQVYNGTAGTAAEAGINLAVSGGYGMLLRTLSNSFTSSGIAQAGRAVIQENAANGLNIGTVSGVSMDVYTNNINRGGVTATGEWQGNIGYRTGGNSTAAGYVDWMENTTDGSNKTRIQAQAMASDITYTLPAAAPTQDGMALVATTGGNMSWQSVSSTGIDTYTVLETDFTASPSNILSLSNFANSGGLGATPTTSTFGVDGTEQASGVVDCATSTSTGGGSTVSDVTWQHTFGFGFTYELTWRVALSALSNGTDTYTARVGFADAANTTAAIVDGAYFRYTHGTNSGKWQAVTISNSVETAQDTGVAAASGTFSIFKVVTDPSAANVKFYIDGALVNTISTNVINSSARLTGRVATIEKTAGSTSRSLYVDYVRFVTSRTTAR